MPRPSRKRRPVDDLFETVKTYPDEYWDDLRRVIELENSGKKRPSFGKLSQFFAGELGINIPASTVSTHYQKLKRESADA